MQKPLTLVLSFALLLSLCACEGNTASPNTESSSTPPTADAYEQDAQNSETPTEPDNNVEETQSNETSAEEEKTQNNESSAEPEEIAEQEAHIWEKYYYVDNFDEPTDEGYIINSTYFVGTFSNSATTKSELLVSVIVDETNIAFFLYEYGWSQAKNSSSRYDNVFNITMRTDDGTDYTFTGTMYRGSDRLFINTAYVPTVITALSQGSSTSFYIEDTDRTSTNYLFTITSGNFAKQYEELFQ